MDKNKIVRAFLHEDTRDAFLMGEALFIRCVTYHLTGRIIGFKQLFGVGFLALEEAAWVASDGPFTKAIEEGVLDEVEPVTGPVRVNVRTIVDAYVWRHPLPRTQK